MLILPFGQVLTASAVVAVATLWPPRVLATAADAVSSNATFQPQDSAPAMMRVGAGCCRFDNWEVLNKGSQPAKACMGLCQESLACVAANVYKENDGQPGCLLFYGFGEDFRVECSASDGEVCYKKNVTLPAAPATRGACTNARDFFTWTFQGQKEFHYDMFVCARPCYGESGCVAGCVEKNRGYSPGCASCFGILTDCTGLNCVVPCVSGGDACAQCVLDTCMPAWTRCTGLADDVGVPQGLVAERRLDAAFAAEGRATPRLPGEVWWLAHTIYA